MPYDYDPRRSTVYSDLVLTEMPGNYSREVVTIVASAGTLPAGRLLGKITASSKFKNYDDAAVDGSQTAVAIALNEIANNASDQTATVLVRCAEVVSGRVTANNPAHLAAGKADLEAIVTATNVGGIRFR